MEFDDRYLVLMKGSVMRYMLGRFPIANINHIVPRYETIRNSEPVSKMILALKLGEDGGHYLRESLKLLTDEENLVVCKSGTINSFSGEGGLESMFDSIADGNNVDCVSIGSHLGYATPYDISLIFADINNGPYEH